MWGIFGVDWLGGFSAEFGFGLMGKLGRAWVVRYDEVSGTFQPVSTCSELFYVGPPMEDIFFDHHIVMGPYCYLQCTSLT